MYLLSRAGAQPDPFATRSSKACRRATYFAPNARNPQLVPPDPWAKPNDIHPNRSGFSLHPMESKCSQAYRQDETWLHLFLVPWRWYANFFQYYDLRNLNPKENFATPAIHAYTCRAHRQIHLINLQAHDGRLRLEKSRNQIQRSNHF